MMMVMDIDCDKLGFVSMSFGLPLCPPDRIEEALGLMMVEVANISPAIDAFAEDYIAYIRQTYMSGSYGNEQEGYEWNAYERIPDGFLTNNPSEGANNRLCLRCGTIHPGIYRFCALLKKETENVKNKCEQFEQGALQPARSTTRASKVKQNRIQLKSMLERGQQSLRKYLRTLGRMNHVVKQSSSRARRGGQNLGAASLLRGLDDCFAHCVFIIYLTRCTGVC